MLRMRCHYLQNPTPSKQKSKGIYKTCHLENGALARPFLTLLLFLLSSLYVLCRLRSFGLGCFRLWSLTLGSFIGSTLQSGEANLGNVLVEGLALDLGNLQLERGWLTGAISTLLRRLVKSINDRHRV